MPTAKKAAKPVEPASDHIETEVRLVDPRSLRPAPENARFMTAQQQKRLNDNITADGALTSVPLIYQDGDVLEILSGHHRIDAAIAAGLEKIYVMVIVTPLPRSRRTAIQLSHNEITGQDDPSKLLELYSGLDLSMKAYSGLTDDKFKGLAEIDVGALSLGSVKYQELFISFLPGDRDVFVGFLADIEKSVKKGREYLVARAEEFGALFDLIVKIKSRSGVHNSAVAMMALVELARERLAQLEQEDENRSETEIQGRAG